MKYGGRVLFLDRDDINTDEIIPARYLSEAKKEALRPFLLEDLRLDGFEQKRDIARRGAVVSRGNFGCGSSREHAPWALEANGINIVAASSFARIFRQNMFNCGMIAAEVEPAALDTLFRDFSALDTEVECNLEKSVLVFKAGGKTFETNFNLTPFDRALIEAGGWLEYADKHF